MAGKSWEEVFDEEKTVIGKWRKNREKRYPEGNSITRQTRDIGDKGKPDNSETPADEAPDDLVGLAFSGGGIRSATFGLGVLEALKGKGLLTKIDYLSSVSGGGYIGSWLSANCLRQGKEWLEREYDEDGNVAEGKSWKESITHLRRYSNYLAPDLSLLSPDSWTMVTIWLRNTLLIQLMLVFAIALLLSIARLILFSFEFHSTGKFHYGFYYFVWLMSLLMLGIVVVKTDLKTILKKIKATDDEIADQSPKQTGSLKKLILTPVIFLLIGGFYFSILLWLQGHKGLINGLSGLLSAEDLMSYSGCLKIIGILNSPILLIFYISCIKLSDASTNKNEIKINYILAPLTATIVLTLSLAGVLLLLSGWGQYGSSKGMSLAYVWAPTLVIGGFSLAINLLIGIWGINTDEYVREWWSRLAAWLAIIGFSWMVIVIVAVYGPLWSFWLYYEGEGAWKSIGSGWVFSTLAGLFAGKSADTGSTGRQKTLVIIKEIVAKLAPFVFIAGLLIAVSTLLHIVIAYNSNDSFNLSREQALVDDSKHLTENWVLSTDKSIAKTLDETFIEKKPDNITLSVYEDEQKPFDYEKHWDLITQANPLFIFATIIVCVICIRLLGKRVDINEFSLNAFYRNRLARCYLGASRKPEERDPHLFIGFDAKDDFDLSELLLKTEQGKEPLGPFHILNCALNLGGSSDLGVHTRHSNSFTLTPLHCGSSYVIKNLNGTDIGPIGYIDTENYGGDKRPTLGQAVSVSGAAASPNMGYHTSAPVAFLMTLFNARLGWWFPNPFKSECNASSPSFSLEYLLYELFGLADEKRKFLNISDGGHFENLAAYELVKRRCKVIIISDGECDPNMRFEGLANLIRLCEVDRLAKIEIDVSAIKPSNETGWSHSRCVVGNIRYSAFPENNQKVADGKLLYVKAAMTGHEDTAILQYKATHPDFPHETTGDQFYAEDQFESYRNLGKNITEQVFSKWDKKNQDQAETSTVVNPFPEMSMVDISESLYDILSPEVIDRTRFIHHADKLIDLWKQLSEDEKLTGFEKMDTILKNIENKDDKAPIYYLCNEIIQLMENVYLDLNLEETWNRDENIGWMKLFIDWANNEHVIDIWESTKHTYGIKFKSFWDRKLKSR